MSKIEALELLEDWVDKEKGRLEYEEGYWALYKYLEDENGWYFLYENTSLIDLLDFIEDNLKK